MQGHPNLWFVWPVSVMGVILVAALWPHSAPGLFVACPSGWCGRVCWYCS